MTKIAKSNSKTIMGLALGASLIGISSLGSAAPAALLDLTEDKRSLSGFDGVVLKGPIDSVIHVGKSFSVTVEAPDDMIDRVLTEVQGGSLVVKLKKGDYSWKDYNKIKVYVSLPKMEAYMSAGSGDSAIKGKIDGSKFSVMLKGSGDIDVETSTAKKLSLDIKGSGDIKIGGGRCDMISATIKGSGDITTNAVKCGDGDFNIMGSGDIRSYANKAASVTIRGSGDVTLYGSPDTLKSRTYGSGEVTTRK